MSRFLLWFPAYETDLASPYASDEVMRRLRAATKGRFNLFGPSDVIGEFGGGAAFLTFAPLLTSADPTLRLTMEVLPTDTGAGSSLYCITHAPPWKQVLLSLWYSIFLLVGLAVTSGAIVLMVTKAQAEVQPFGMLGFGGLWLAGILWLWTTGLAANRYNHIYLIHFLRDVLNAAATGGDIV